MSEFGEKFIFDCEAFTVWPRDNNSIFVFGSEDGTPMTLEEILAFGKAIVKYFETERGVNVSFN